MVEVTKHNFESQLDQIGFDLKKCTFYSIDCEFTNIPTDSFLKSVFDGSEERYTKVRENLDGCFIVEVGLTPFIFNRDLNNYQACLYKFYVAPCNFGTLDQNIVLKASTLKFLCENDFNFNKTFFNGITSLNQPQERMIRNEIKTGEVLHSLTETISFDDYDKIDALLSDVKLWRMNSNLGDSMEIVGKTHDVNYNYLLQEEIRNSSNKLWTFQGSNETIIVKNVGEGERKELESRHELDEKTVDTLLGFSKVFRLMVDSKKPLVGHNLYLDLIAMYAQFHKTLPRSFCDFKTELHSLFPHIFDTKYMSYEIQKLTKKDVLSNNSLGNLYDLYKDKNDIFQGTKVVFDSGIYSDVKNQHMHDAGWDAYTTGYCFVKLCHVASTMNTGGNSLRPISSTEQLRCVEFLKNRVNLPRARISHLNLDGPEPKTTRPPLLYVSANRGCKTYNKLEMILKKHPNVHTKTISPFAKILAALNYPSYKDVLKDLAEHKDFQIEKYSLLKHNKVIRPLLFAGVIIPAALTLWLGIKTIRE